MAFTCHLTFTIVRSVWDMSFLKRHWLYASGGLFLLLCIVLGAILVWRANQPVEPKTIYALPEPNPERAEILKRALQPPKTVYATTTEAYEGATTGSTTDESLETDSAEFSREEGEFEDDDLESMLAQLDEETAEEKGEFPPVPEGYPFTPVWIKRPGYQKGICQTTRY